MGSLAFFDDNDKYLKLSELIEAFVHALPKTQRIAQLNPRLAVPQGFLDTKHCKYRMELLLPIIIKFPKFNGNYYKFVLAIGKSTEKEKVYNVKSILTIEMAYANARLVGYVDSLWLHSPNKKNGINISPVPIISHHVFICYIFQFKLITTYSLKLKNEHIIIFQFETR